MTIRVRRVHDVEIGVAVPAAPIGGQSPAENRVIGEQPLFKPVAGLDVLPDGTQDKLDRGQADRRAHRHCDAGVDEGPTARQPGLALRRHSSSPTPGIPTGPLFPPAAQGRRHRSLETGSGFA